MQKHPVSKRLLNYIKTQDAGNWIAVDYIKPEGYGRAAKAEMQRMGVDDAVIEEASDEELEILAKNIKLPKLLPFEKRVRNEIGLEPDEFEITSSPQIDRLIVQESNVAMKENGKYKFTNIVAHGTPFAVDLADRMKEHHAIRVVTTREKARKVLDYVKANGGPKKMLMDIDG